MIFEKDFIDFLKLLNHHQVEYMIIGGHSMKADISGVTFDQAYPNKKMVTIQGIQVPFIGVHDLIKNKLASGRDQDIVDVKKLRKGLRG